ncbi:PIN domain-containing protein [Methanolapillus millepedarum]|uniref:PIN domain-containing protein n=1 Tax=Methanolapillus millepedarum TaxID=3028296 RepID=A0AA96ZTH1_9EURY|nr:hypothetical protein MsAc7_00510 [Methanosarcinaceae archaeon Ac7]
MVTEKPCVLLDTNGFMVPIQFGIDIFSELRRLGFSTFIVPDAVAAELEHISKKVTGADKMAARVAISMAFSSECFVISVCDFPNISGKKHVDDIILEISVQYGLPVLTNDAVLRKRLMTRGIRVISMRQTSKLDFIDQK